MMLPRSYGLTSSLFGGSCHVMPAEVSITTHCRNKNSIQNKTGFKDEEAEEQ